VAQSVAHAHRRQELPSAGPAGRSSLSGEDRRHLNIFQCIQCLKKPEILKDEPNGHAAIGSQGVAFERSDLVSPDQEASRLDGFQATDQGKQGGLACP
jgi:hypothetical protein